MNRPPVSAAPSPTAVLAEIGGAMLGGVLLAPLLAYGTGFLMQGSELGMGVLSLMVFAAVIGFGVGGGIGAGLVGRAMRQGGSTWLAALIGGVGAVLVILFLRLLNINVGGLFGILGVGAPLVVALAVIGYNLRRRPL